MEDENRRKCCLLIIMALLVAFLAYSVAQNAQNTANIANQTANNASVNGSSINGSFLNKTSDTVKDTNYNLFSPSGNQSLSLNNNQSACLINFDTITGNTATVCANSSADGQVTDGLGQTVGWGANINSFVISFLDGINTNEIVVDASGARTYVNGLAIDAETSVINMYRNLDMNNNHILNNPELNNLSKNDSYFNGTVFPNSTNFRNDSLVPYTGATSDVNLGTHNITAKKGTFTNITGEGSGITNLTTSSSGYFRQFWQKQGTAVAGSWTWVGDGAQTNYASVTGEAAGVYYDSTAANNDEYKWANIYLGKGHYTITLVDFHGYSNGISEFLFGTTSLGTVDQYSAGVVHNVVDTFNFDVTTASRQDFRYKVTGKNGASSGYQIVFSRIQIEKTGEI